MWTTEQRNQVGLLCPACKIIINGEGLRARLLATWTLIRYKQILLATEQFRLAVAAVNKAFVAIGEAASIAGTFKPITLKSPDPVKGLEETIAFVRGEIEAICETQDPDNQHPMAHEQQEKIIEIFNQLEDDYDAALLEITTAA